MRSLSSLLAKIFAITDPISDHLYFSTCCFDFLLSALSKSLSSNGQSFCEFTVSQNTYTIENVFQNTCFNESSRINNSVVIETIERFYIDYSIFFCKDIFKAAFRETAICLLYTSDAADE